jgi:predicted enzyme related to lactoylglutathione lyase
MTLSVGMVTFDSANPLPLAQWWAAQLGGEIAQGASEWFAMVGLPGGQTLGFQKVPDPTPGKNRIHLDFGSDDRAAEVARLTAAGASFIGDREHDGFGWTTLADPDGNQFCVSES